MLWISVSNFFLLPQTYPILYASTENLPDPPLHKKRNFTRNIIFWMAVRRPFKGQSPVFPSVKMVGILSMYCTYIYAYTRSMFLPTYMPLNRSLTRQSDF